MVVLLEDYDCVMSDFRDTLPPPSPESLPGIPGAPSLQSAPPADLAAPSFPPVIRPTPLVEPTQPQVYPVSPAAIGRPVKGRRSRGLIASVVALSLGLIGALGASGYFWYAADRWHEVSQAWEDQAITQGAVNIEIAERLNDAVVELEATRQELAGATDRITELADDWAQLGDEQVVTQAQFDAQLAAHQHNVQVAVNVAAALATCIEGQKQVIQALENPGRYTAESVAAVVAQVTQICQTASNANNQLQQDLD